MDSAHKWLVLKRPMTESRTRMQRISIVYILHVVFLSLATTGCGEPELNQRIKVGNTAAAEKLITDGANVNAAGIDRQTPLLAAFESNNKEIFHSLLQHGADPNARHANGATVVHMAARRDDVFWLSEVLAHGGNVDMLNTGNRHYPKQTPIYYAIERHKTININMLFDANANINITEYYGKSPVYYCMEYQMYSSARLMIEKGADRKLWAEGEWSILDRSGWFDDPKIFREVLSEGKRAEYDDLCKLLAKMGYLPRTPNDVKGATQE